MKILIYDSQPVNRHAAEVQLKGHHLITVYQPKMCDQILKDPTISIFLTNDLVLGKLAMGRRLRYVAILIDPMQSNFNLPISPPIGWNDDEEFRSHYNFTLFSSSPKWYAEFYPHDLATKKTETPSVWAKDWSKVVTYLLS